MLNDGSRTVASAHTELTTPTELARRRGVGRVREGANGPVPSKHASDIAHPDGAQPPRAGARVPRGPLAPSRTPPGAPPPTPCSDRDRRIGASIADSEQ